MTPADLDRTASSLLIFLFDAAVRASVMAAAIGVPLFLLRHRGAAFRLRGWTLVLCAALAIPALSVVAPVWQWSIPILQMPGARSAAITPAASVATFSTEAGTAARSFEVSVAMIAGTIYMAGVLLLLIEAGLAWRATRRLRSSAQPVDDAVILAAVGRYASAAGLRTEPRVLESPQIPVPATMFVRQPIVMLPEDWRDWPAERLDAALIHEIAHIARRDALTQRISLFYRAALWISPLSWWLHRHIASLAEQASDEAALRAGVAPATYAEALLVCFIRVQRQGRGSALHVAMARRADANAARRVDRILNWSGGTIMRSKLWLVGLVVVAVPVVVLTASVQFASVTAEPPALASPTAPAAPAPVALASVAPVPVAPTKPRVLKSSTPATSAAVAPQADQQTRPIVVIPPDDDFAAGAFDQTTPGFTFPQVLREVKPRYSMDAMRAKLQGTVAIEAIVSVDGRVEKARVIRSLDSVWGLDEEALTAARGWVFTPARVNGEIVRARIILELEFRLH